MRTLNLDSGWHVCEEDAVWFDCPACGKEHLIGPDEKEKYGSIECNGRKFYFVWLIMEVMHGKE